MSMQTTFDFIVNELVKQGRPSVVDGSSRCRYRTTADDGVTVLKCAVGHLIPDAEYKPYFDAGGGLRFSQLPPDLRDRIARGAVASGGNMTLSIEFVNDMQNAHDEPFLLIQAEAEGPSNAEWLRRFLYAACRIADGYMLDSANVRRHMEVSRDQSLN